MIGAESQFALAFAVFEQKLQRGRIAFEAAAEATDELRRDGLEDEPVFFLDERHSSALADGVFASELGWDDELALGGDGGDFRFHTESSMVEQDEGSISMEKK